MAKKQTRRSISVSRTTYERLKAFCETNNISMSQLVETRVNDFLGPDAPGAATGTGLPMTAAAPSPMAPRPMAPMAPRASLSSATPSRPVEPRPQQASLLGSSSGAPGSSSGSSSLSGSSSGSGAGSGHGAGAGAQQSPMTSAAARFAVDPPPPIIKPRQDTAAPKPAEKRPEQIFTF
jgi:uncharacterized membrane protein YgcG